jgi:putative heme iron utilization protein
MTRPDPHLPADDTARALAADLLAQVRHAALAMTDPDLGSPFISRIALGLLPGGALVSLMSGLSLHTRALRANPDCALLIGEPGPKGDPLTHPRLSLRAQAHFIARDQASALRDGWLDLVPKSKLYIDFPDFVFVRFTPGPSLLNGGFAKAWILQPGDMPVR